MNLETALADTSYDLELEKLKKKIASLYQELLTKQFRASNPGATQVELDAFMDANALEFKEDSEDFDDEADGLEKLLELLSQEEDLDKVEDKTYEKPEVEQGKKLKSNKDALTTPKTSALVDPKGGMFTPRDKRTQVLTKALKTPRGTIKRMIDDDPKVSTQSLKDIWDAEREKLLHLVKRRNLEHGVKL
tara:strand:- start:863 stop:1432 length:570 start_codon:yes stop_codon:yes gene_type:complete